MRTVGGTALSWTSSAITEGTVLISVSRRFSSADMAARARALSTRWTAPPQASVPKISKTDMSKQIEVEPSTAASSAGLNVARVQRISTVTLRCSIATPLGRPVDPEV